MCTRTQDEPSGLDPVVFFGYGDGIRINQLACFECARSEYLPHFGFILNDILNQI